jgi:hypothetical protein
MLRQGAVTLSDPITPPILPFTSQEISASLLQLRRHGIVANERSRRAEIGSAMGILLAFAPFIAFAVVDRFVGSMPGLIAGALVSVALLVRDYAAPGRSPKLLEIGTALLFCGLALYAALEGANWSVIATRLFVDTGLFVIVVVSMLLGRPFTLQYARERVAPGLWNSPTFVRTNYIITAVWGAAFAVMIIAELALLYVPGIPQRAGIIVIVLAIVGAVKFTGWYPERVKIGA